MILVKRRHRKRTDTAPRCPGLRVSSLWILAGLWLAPASPGQDDALLEPFVVTEDALTPWEGSVGYSGRTLSRSEMALRPGATFSDQLQGEGGLRLFRRQSALTVHPTAQGASLRVGGPNGASRATVYLDGTPLNDPFGGWIPWTSLNSLAVGRISVVQPSGVDPWGNVSFGGTLRLERRREDPFFSLEGSTGTAVEHQIASAFLVASPSGRTRIHGSWLRLDSAGYHVIHPQDRGTVDRKATASVDAASLGWGHRFDSPWSMEAELAFHEERRGNGTVIVRNAQEAWLARLALVRERGASDWEGRLTAYGQARDFSSVFSSVTDERDAERAVLDQFDVLGKAAGVIWRARHWSGENHEWLWGLEGRVVEGETW